MSNYEFKGISANMRAVIEFYSGVVDLLQRWRCLAEETEVNMGRDERLYGQTLVAIQTIENELEAFYEWNENMNSFTEEEGD